MTKARNTRASRRKWKWLQNRPTPDRVEADAVLMKNPTHTINRTRRRFDRGDNFLHKHLKSERDACRRNCCEKSGRKRNESSADVKTSLAPGSRVVTDYLEKTDLQKYLDELGFNLVGYGCTTCIGNSGPLDPAIEEAIVENDLVAASVFREIEILKRVFIKISRQTF